MTLIYHITHINNLPRILTEYGFCCDRIRSERGIACTGIAHQHIKARRANRSVPVARGSTLDDYVPFYFAPRSPMLYAIATGNVANYSDGQAPVLHLVLEAEEIINAGHAFAFTDGHAEIAYTKYFADLKDLRRVDWEIMQTKWWKDTPEDGDRKRRRQAEFLVHEFVPWSFVRKIGVLDATYASKVMHVLAGSSHVPQVRIEREWYY